MAVAQVPYGVLPEDTRFALRYKRYGNVEDALSLSNAGNFGVGLILPFKILQFSPDAQQRLLEVIVNNIGGEGGYEKAYTALKDFFYARHGGSRYSPVWLPNDEFRDLNTRLRSEAANLNKMVVIYGQETVDNEGANIANEVFERGDIPVIKPNAGLVALKHFVDNLPQGVSLYLIKPQYLGRGSIVYSVEHGEHGDELQVSRLSPPYKFNPRGGSVENLTNNST